MSKGTMACPECGHGNATPAAGTKKITCEGCGMIIVMAKTYGENWATKAAPAEAARPKIVTRRDRASTPAKAPTPEPAESGRAPTRGGRGTKGKSAEGLARPTRGSRASQHGHDHDHGGHHHQRGPKGMSPAIVWGSIAGILIVGVLAAVVIKNSMDEDAAKKAKEEAALTTTAAKPSEALGDLPPIESQGKEITTSAIGNSAPDPAPAAEKVEKRKPTPKIKRDYTPFPVDDIDPEVKKLIDASIVVLKDLGATTALRGANRDLFEHRREAIPVLINELWTIKLDDEKDVLRGWSLIQAVKTCAEHETEYENDFNVMTWPTETAQIEIGVRRRTTAIQKWHEWWTKYGATWKPAEDTLDE